MASIIKTSINLNNIPKDKIIEGKKGKYLPITITINDELDQFGNNGPVVVAQSKEEREAKVAKVYLGNVQVVWTNGVGLMLLAIKNKGIETVRAELNRGLDMGKPGDTGSI